MGASIIEIEELSEDVNNHGGMVRRDGRNVRRADGSSVLFLIGQHFSPLDVSYCPFVFLASDAISAS